MFFYIDIWFQSTIYVLSFTVIYVFCKDERYFIAYKFLMGNVNMKRRSMKKENINGDFPLPSFQITINVRIPSSINFHKMTKPQ